MVRRPVRKVRRQRDYYKNRDPARGEEKAVSGGPSVQIYVNDVRSTVWRGNNTPIDSRGEMFGCVGLSVVFRLVRKKVLVARLRGDSWDWRQRTGSKLYVQ